MSKQEVTPWFPASVKPVRVGVYECKYARTDLCDEYTEKRYWNGLAWLLREGGIRAAFGESWSKRDQWRGLTKP